MVDDNSVVEQAHEIQALVKDLEMHGCELPDKFVAGCMIAKLRPSWEEYIFATSLNTRDRSLTFLNSFVLLMWKIRQGQKMSRERKLQRVVLAHMWCKRVVLNHRRRKTNKMCNQRKLLLSRRRRRRTRSKATASLVASLGILLEIAQMQSGSQIRRN
jgi:hypothetical protein